MARGPSFATQLLKGTTPLLVLSVIGEGELYGYEIAQRVREQSGGAFAPSEGSLYPALHRLEADGALAATWRDSDRGPRRRYYRLTDRGRGLLAESRAEWSAFVRTVDRVAVPGR
ncbi:MAG: helix-turn-helix transcriptional regulator [Chloroflexi bacterium]|nr:helix-turn-helix transcriptional regulator [Chloroflexota bacterium]